MLMSINGYCQSSPRNWNWYFGDSAAISFSSGSPVAISGSAMSAYEGSASISDATGNLLFYTSGTFVWNRNNTVMPNGSWLAGTNSSTQSALIIPKPDSSNIYYVFTSADGALSPGICYSEVDMSLNSGLGDVTVKNVQLLNPASEKLVGVRHCNGTDYWVIAHGPHDSVFYSYLVTNAGVSNPIITNIGTSYNQTNDIIGYLKVSPNAKKIAAALTHSGIADLFDFDNSTGILSNFISLPNCIYGLSFSPDNHKIYFSSLGSVIFQYDISSNNQATIIASEYQINTASTNNNAMQLAPDNKIYIGRYGSHFLGVINSPNILGAGCDYVDSAVSLGSGKFFNGLPNFIDAYTGCSNAGINEQISQEQISLYPNPASTILNIHHSTCISPETLLITDLLGTAIYQQPINNSTQSTIDISTWSAGIYFYCLTPALSNGEGVSVRGKFIKE